MEEPKGWVWEIKSYLKPHPHLSLEPQGIALKHWVVLGTMLWEMLSATVMIIIMAANKCFSILHTLWSVFSHSILTPTL